MLSKSRKLLGLLLKHRIWGVGLKEKIAEGKIAKEVKIIPESCTVRGQVGGGRRG